MHAALAGMPEAARRKPSTAGECRIALGCLVSTILGLPAYAERRLRLRNFALFPV